MWTLNRVKKQSTILFAVIAIDLLSFGMLIPILPTLFREASSPLYIAAGIPVNMIYIALGAFTAVYGFGQFFANPILGSLSDRYGRKNTLVYAISGTVVSRIVMLLGILTQSFWIVILSRFFDGATGGIISLSQASIADITAKADRAKYLGLIGAAFGVGFVFGPALGALLSLIDLPYFDYAPFILGIAFSLIALLLLVFKFEETLDRDIIKQNLLNKFKATREIKIVIQNIFIVLRNKKYTKYFIVFLFCSLGFSMYTPYIAIYLKDYFNYTELHIGIILTIAGVAISLTQGLLAYKFINKFGQEIAIKLGLVCAGLSIASLVLFTSFWYAPFVSTLFIAFGISISSVAITSGISKKSGESEQGTVLGVSSSLQVLAIGLAPIIGGAASYFNTSFSLLLSAIFILISWLIFIIWRE
jgi:MFS transporter, DHA1 family, tetracycline resistance protein